MFTEKTVTLSYSFAAHASGTIKIQLFVRAMSLAMPKKNDWIGLKENEADTIWAKKLNPMKFGMFHFLSSDRDRRH